MPYVYTFLAGGVAGAFAFYYIGKSVLAHKIEAEIEAYKNSPGGVIPAIMKHL